MKANFQVDVKKCIGCGICLYVCPGNMVGGNVLKMQDGHPVMIDENNYSWRGCWRCQHCLAVCPKGAISIFDINPEDVSSKPSHNIKEDLPKLMKFRRSCRAYKKDDVLEEIIDELMSAVSAVPTGGNNYGLEFTVVSSRKAMGEIYHLYKEENGLSLFDENQDDYSELRIYDAPHLFIAHKELGDRFKDGGISEINFATAYFELVANAYGLGTIISTYSAELLTKSKAIRDYLHIPENHRVFNVVGFGYPQYPYQRGAKKNKKTYKIK